MVQKIAEHEEYYQGELNIIERITAGISSTDDFLRLTNIILHRQLEVMKLFTGQGTTQPLPGGGLTAPTLGVRTKQLIKGYNLRSTEIVEPENMVSSLSANRVLLIVNNGLNQDVRVYVIGNTSNNSVSAFRILLDICPSGQLRAYGLKKEEWMPWIGIQVQAWTTPTTGNVAAEAIIQE